MIMINSILDLIGNTPLFHIQGTDIYAKLECFNPTGSIKDRTAKQMILGAIEDGSLKKDSIVIEPTSGNTGIGLAAIGNALGYSVMITMPETMSKERRNLIKSYGATLVLTDGSKGMEGAIQKAYELKKELKNVYIPNQFENPNNTLAHYYTTGPELWKDMEGKIDILVAGIGTGGTITGAGRFLKEKNPNLQIIGVEPAQSPILSKGYKGVHHIEGIGAGFVPKILDSSLLDEIFCVRDEEAKASARDFVQQTGISIGISSGAALFAAKEVSKRFPDKKIAVILPDSGNRYLSTDLFELS